MNSTLFSELSKFCCQANRLKQIFSDTKRCFEDINNSGRFDGTQVVSAELLKEEESEITSIFKHPQTIVIFGQTPYAKSRIVNELFNKNVFPSLEAHSNVRLRMVRIYHGNTNTVSLTLPDDYDLMDNLEAYNGPWITLPQTDLEIPTNDNASGLAVMEVTQNHPLLRFGTQVVVSPSSTENQFEEVVKQCTENATPLLIYGIASDRLTEVIPSYDMTNRHQQKECHFCYKNYISRGNMVPHIQEVHHLVRYICHVCGLSYTRTDSSLNHLKQKHPSNETATSTPSSTTMTPGPSSTVSIVPGPTLSASTSQSHIKRDIAEVGAEKLPITKRQ